MQYCGCEYGGSCTRSSLCAVLAVKEDLENEILEWSLLYAKEVTQRDQRIYQLEAALRAFVIAADSAAPVDLMNAFAKAVAPARAALTPTAAVDSEA